MESSLFVYIFQGITLVKIAVAVFMVVALSLLAEHVSTKFAGMISGFPLGTAVSLFFIGYEIGPEYASKSSVYSILGLAATLAFVYGYRLTIGRVGALSKIPAILACSVGGLACYFVAAAVLERITFNLVTGTVFTSAVIIALIFVYKNIQTSVIVRAARPGIRILLARASAAAAIIVAITTAAHVIGPRWSGLLAAFPITMFPFLVIIHFTYSAEHVQTIIKNVPRGIGSIVAYCIGVRWTYTAVGVYWGTLASYGLAVAYLVAIHLPVWTRSYRNGAKANRTS